MNKRQLKKLRNKQEVTKDDAQSAWNIVARYLNKRPELSFYIDPWNKKDENRYTLSSVGYGEILIANTKRK
jgi:hypothetical protein